MVGKWILARCDSVNFLGYASRSQDAPHVFTPTVSHRMGQDRFDIVYQWSNVLMSCCRGARTCTALKLAGDD
jgi:hypothetical protein